MPTDATEPVDETEAVAPTPLMLLPPEAPTVIVPPGVVIAPPLLVSWPMAQTPVAGRSRLLPEPNAVLLLSTPTEATTPVLPMDAPLSRPEMAADVVMLSAALPVTAPELVMGAGVPLFWAAVRPCVIATCAKAPGAVLRSAATATPVIKWSDLRDMFFSCCRVTL